MKFFKALGVAFKAFFAEFNSENPQNFLPPTSESQSSITSDFQDRAPSHISHQRSEAIELLAALQREARFIDFIKDDISVTSCSRETLFEIVKMVHDRCADTCEKIFSIRPLSDEDEIKLGSSENPRGDSTQAKITNTTEHKLLTEGPNSRPNKRIIHHGWYATKCDLPKWQGDKKDEFVIAPREYEA